MAVTVRVLPSTWALRISGAVLSMVREVVRYAPRPSSPLERSPSVRASTSYSPFSSA